MEQQYLDSSLNDSNVIKNFGTPSRPGHSFNDSIHFEDFDFIKADQSAREIQEDEGKGEEKFVLT